MSNSNPRARGFDLSESQNSVSDSSAVAPVITYNVICQNQPNAGTLAQISQSGQQVLAQLPFQVNTEVVYSEDELFKVMYNKIVAKLEADRDASSAGKHN